MNHHEIDVPPKNDSLLSIEIGLLSEDLERLQAMLQVNPNLKVSEILLPEVNSHEAKVRELAIRVFMRAWNIVGRNSPEAVFEDAKKRITIANNQWLIPDYAPNLWRRQNADIWNRKKWLESHIWPYLDNDMSRFLYSMLLYRVRLPKLYENIKIWAQRNTDGLGDLFNRN